MRPTLDEHRRRLGQEEGLHARGAESPEAGRSIVRARRERGRPGILEDIVAEHQAICGSLARCEAAAREDLVDRADVERLGERLETLMRLEEEVLHPALAREASFRGDVEVSQVEHRVMRRLLDDLAAATHASGHRATLRVLARFIRQHMEEEVYQLFPRVQRSTLDLDAIGEPWRAMLGATRNAADPRPRSSA